MTIIKESSLRSKLVKLFMENVIELVIFEKRDTDAIDLLQNILSSTFSFTTYVKISNTNNHYNITVFFSDTDGTKRLVETYLFNDEYKIKQGHTSLK